MQQLLQLVISTRQDIDLLLHGPVTIDLGLQMTIKLRYSHSHLLSLLLSRRYLLLQRTDTLLVCL